jgi:dipeptidyl aminopeptidase/acylaminoacyl peptidase
MGSSSEAQFKDKGAPQFPRRPGRGVPAQPAGNAANTFWCAVFSPDGKTLAAVGGAQETPGKLMVWDLPKARMKFQANEAKGIRSVAYSPDGKSLALALYDGKVKLLDAATLKEQMVLPGHANGVNCVAFSPDGLKLASASLDQTAKLWDLKTGKEQMTLRGHTEYVLCVAFSPDGKMLGTSSGTSLHPQTGGNAKLWDVATGKEQATLESPQTPIEYLAFSPDGQTVATASWDGNVKIWETKTGKCQTTFAAHVQGVFCLQFSRDGKTLATAGGTGRGPAGEVKLSEVPSGREIAVLPHPSNVWSVQFSPDDRTLAVACWDNTVKLWELASRKERAVFGMSSAAQVGSAAPSPSSEQISAWWTDLGSADAMRAYRAMWSLTDAGKPAVQLIQERIHELTGEKAVAVDSKRVAKLIAQLDDDDAQVRERATGELKGLGQSAEPAIRQALEKAASAEADFRLKLLLSQLSGETPRTIHLVRAVEVLENQASPEARKLLEELAQDTKDLIRKEAKDSLARLVRRDPKKPSAP